MKLYYTGLSDVGNVRTNNEDYIYTGQVNENDYLFITADGMGGHHAGEVASRKAVTQFVRKIEQGIGTEITESLKTIVKEINQSLMDEGNRSKKKNKMGTTLTVLYITEESAYIVHVGDSRVYWYNKNGDRHNQLDQRLEHNKQTPGFIQLTDDHSFVGQLLKNGLITEQEARVHPRRNVLYQSVGLKKDINIQAIGPITLQIGDKFLLCSDGLHGVVPDATLKELLETQSNKNAAKKLIKKAKQNGGPDNISVIVVSTEKDSPKKKVDKTTPDMMLEDTVEIPPITTNTTKKKKKTGKGKTGIFLLLILLILLLAAAVYILVTGAETHRGQLPPSTPMETEITKNIFFPKNTDTFPVKRKTPVTPQVMVFSGKKGNRRKHEDKEVGLFIGIDDHIRRCNNNRPGGKANRRTNDRLQDTTGSSTGLQRNVRQHRIE